MKILPIKNGSGNITQYRVVINIEHAEKCKLINQDREVIVAVKNIYIDENKLIFELEGLKTKEETLTIQNKIIDEKRKQKKEDEIKIIEKAFLEISKNKKPILSDLENLTKMHCRKIIRLTGGIRSLEEKFNK